MALHYTMSLGLQAQATFKHHEIRLGQPGAYFFDDEQYKLNRMKEFYCLPTYISICKQINKSFALSLNYTYLWLSYEHDNRLFFPNKILRRNMNIVDVKVNSSIKFISKVTVNLSFGINYRFHGTELFFVRYTITNIIPWEIFLESRKYNSLGVSAGTGIK